MSDAEDDVGSLEDFIVDDEEASRELKRARLEAQDDDGDEAIKVLAEEAERFAGTVTGTIVGGRVLRSREPEKIEARRPKDAYYERFGRDVEARLMEKFTKKDIIEFVKTLEKEYREAYEATGETWPVLTTKMSLESIREKYDAIKVFADLPDSDDETEDSEEDVSGTEEEGTDEDESEEEAEEEEES